MSTPDPNWPRWFFASIGDYFKTVADGINLPILIEGIDEREAEKIRAADHVELRINGPAIREISAGYFRVWLDVNLLLTSIMGGQTKNAYDIVQQAGVLQQAASQPIPIFRFGNAPGDDGTSLGCLTARRGRRENVTVFHFGQIGRDERVRQSAVDARFEIYLCN
ncbi:MAG: hypothetical protein DWQ31_16975 [Planctomycetota bacterium]|nr:MAG: hypothetical protein DWQ31_16975 [Planctomycetota bacterium]REJ92048.1 MAG: hypothetical protein DWQ35_12925 [Planctomycetota bacterium]REK28584.1 MAG: hypothetical protein DWQ42_04515 [Planctomycetota bacterium]REK39199.1 MAG: hypothetical protein DWQ46_18100 [Planctomycetota bacterium]